MFSQYLKQYNDLWKMFIRPLRLSYSIYDLGIDQLNQYLYKGPPGKIIKNIPIKRTDFEV